jgi:hypothetical protein
MTHRFILHIPEQYNDGTAVGREVFEAVEERLLEIGGGFTLTHTTGAWRSDDGTIYREPIACYAVGAEAEAQRPLHKLAKLVGTVLRQEAVYLTRHEISAELVTIAAPVAA